MYDRGYISNAECTKCGESFPVFTFVADNDMVTSGSVALTGTIKKDIVLTRMSPYESSEDVERRIGNGYNVVEIEYQSSSRKSKSGSFQAFLKTYSAPVLVYKCVYCGGQASAVKREEKEDFLKHGTIEVRDAL